MTPADLAVLDSIQRRVLWLAVNMIHHANFGRPNPDGTKIGGHQASNASMATILTALYFAFLRPGDRVSIKPHAAPAYHAVQYLLGNLPREYLTKLRAFHGLQSYPSQTKDPDPVDFSTGSVGLGAAAPAFAALAHRYANFHFGPLPAQRFIAVIGDAELDEGNVWEAVTEESLHGLGNILWIVDLNRQSLDRVVPGIRAAQLKALFRDSRWHVVEAKYGRRLQAAFARSGGEAFRRCIDDMSNEEYQFLIRQSGPEIRRRLTDSARPGAPEVARCLADVADGALPSLLSDLGGHDLAELLAAFEAADARHDAPTVLFAYTIKGWGLPIAGDPLNHSLLMTPAQVEQVRRQLDIPPDAEWDAFPPDSPEGRWCRAAAERLRRSRVEPTGLHVPDAIPASLNLRYAQDSSSQAAFGRLLGEIARLPAIGERVVTASPDVAVSTELGTWINRVGVFAHRAEPEYPSDEVSLVRWRPGPDGQHVELGISETNLMMLLGQFGLAAETIGQHLIPIGTVYDPFVCRALDAFNYGLYCGSKFILVGTPSGVSLSPEGGAHQSIVTPSLGIELPGLDAFEPCFAREVEWALMEAIRQCADRAGGRSTYLRLSTKPVDQGLLKPALARLGEEELRRQVLAGGYRLVDWREEAPDLSAGDVVQIAAVGTMVPEAVAAARRLHAEGIAANVLNVTSPGRLYRGLCHGRRQQARQGMPADTIGPLAHLIPPQERRAPIVTVHDAGSHALAFLGSAFGAPVIPLGVEEFGQSGSRADLYAHLGIDEQSIFDAALLALDLV
ncbi:MAG: pyruvate dehydrogenase [Chloroflexi bacterium]|nr:pyruvate dehydrogenase [Chloroflexota bacterium]